MQALGKQGRWILQAQSSRPPLLSTGKVGFSSFTVDTKARSCLPQSSGFRSRDMRPFQSIRVRELCCFPKGSIHLHSNPLPVGPCGVCSFVR